MATKWKSFTRNSWVKAVVWLLILVLTGTAAVLSVQFAEYVSKDDEAREVFSASNVRIFLTREPVADYFAWELSVLASNAYDIANTGSSKEAIRAQLPNESLVSELCQTYAGSDGEDTSDAQEETLDTETVNAIMTYVVGQDLAYEYGIDESGFRSWITAHPAVYEECCEEYVIDEMSYISSSVNQLDQYKDGWDYYAYSAQTGEVVTSLTGDVTATEAETLLTGDEYALTYSLKNGVSDISVGSAMKGSAAVAGMTDKITEYELWTGETDDFVVAAMKNDTYTQMTQAWNALHDRSARLMIVWGIWAAGMLAGSIILCCGAGRRPGEDGCYAAPYDRVWSEVQYTLFFIAFALAVCAFIVCRELWEAMGSAVRSFLLCGSAILLVAVFLLLLTSQARHIKRKNWRNSWILWRICRRGIDWLRRQLQKSPLRRRTLILGILIPLLCAAVVPAPFIAVFLILGGTLLADSVEAVTSGARDIRAGKTDTHITVSQRTTPKELIQLADDLNSISDGLQEAVQTAVKSERLKSELISNVSHDIKTPLTSIVTYLDLLKGCDIQDPTALEYIAVLEQKAQRLQTLTLDLFDASKAASGALKIELTKTDLDALLRQTLGERSEHIERAGLDIRVSSRPPVYVSADGKLLWRILDNLVSNCVRYAVPGSRVYISIERDDGLCRLTMKNISASELNVSADELMQRFTRGDRARHTEGSGLGLSIAQSLAGRMGGDCHVEIDGDLFKAIVEIPEWGDLPESRN